MKLSIAATWAATSVPVETILNSLIWDFMSGVAAYALAILIIWMRQVLPTKPLASARRYGPFLAGHLKYLVLASQGLKHPGFSPGPLTTAGPAARADPATSAAAAATVRAREFMAVS